MMETDGWDLNKDAGDLGRRQRMLVGNGRPMLVSERSSSVTEVLEASPAQVTPYHLQGVASLGFQEERVESGSSRESLSWYR
ncbi:hypothetical protein DEO72_LG8g1429 [Vigna unguiculata]|uniref:Uncharacterized protein n=1 Tax=Vigna unguiculata TaxID=3917 RepID=A0A4D6MU34_VIGUN|nr:hypothetical protein DEO72_LG8g1429 [Vigna unguiculata]